MKRFRSRRLVNRIAFLAIAALLWSQFMLASHPVAAILAKAAAETTSAMPAGCQHPAATIDKALCAAHCNQGDQSKDVGRVPEVPPAPALVAALRWPVVTLSKDRVGTVAPAPPVSWHRPTAHPADLLLI